MKKQRNFYLIAFTVLFFVLSGTCVALATETININTATVDQLTQLKRVGDAYAQRIVEYRETVGPFEKPEDIMKVKGIGKKTWEANKDRIVIGMKAKSQ
jgi:competence protein ComEA